MRGISNESTLGVLRPGERFHERYRVVRLINEGGMGAVYEVVDERTESHRALKVMLPSLVRDVDLRARFEREAKVTGAIESDHLARVSDAAVDPATNMPFMVMDLLRGEDLAALLEKRGTLQSADVVTYLAQAALALDRTHAAGVVHRDLKPANLFLTHRDDGSPCVKILDFGIAKIIAASDQARGTRSIGTPVYMSPEQIQGKGTTDARADIYALAHIAYALLVGEAYWEEEAAANDESIFQLYSTIVLGAKEAPSARARRRKGSALPAVFDAWFAGATAVRPEDRAARATLVIAALGEALEVAGPIAAADSSGGRVVPRTVPAAPFGIGAARTPAGMSAAPASAALRSSGAMIAGVLGLVAAVIIGVVVAEHDSPPVTALSQPAARPATPAHALPVRPVVAGSSPAPWLSEFTLRRELGDEGLSYLAAQERCSARGLALCTETQWSRACAADPDVGTLETWTATADADRGFVVRGGPGCEARRLASGSDASASRAGVCCSRAIALQSRDESPAFLAMASRKLLAFEAANPRGSRGALGTMLADTLQFYTRPVMRREQAIAEIDRAIAKQADFWVLLDTCDVSRDATADTWTAECLKEAGQAGQVAYVLSRFVWRASEGRLISITDPGVMRKFSAP